MKIKISGNVNYNIKYDFENNTYFAYIEELPGCYGEGKTIEEAKQDIEKAIDIWVQIYNERVKG